MRVLIVENHEKTADMLASLVRAAGHDVRACSTCFQAEKIASAFKPDVVLLDIGLPDGNGLD